MHIRMHVHVHMHMHMQVGGTLVFSSAGWITSANTSQCIQRPIEMMLHKLAEEGARTRVHGARMCVCVRNHVQMRARAHIQTPCIGFIKLFMFKWVHPATHSLTHLAHSLT